MKMTRVAGAIVILLGILALIYGGFTYTEETHDADLGFAEIEIQDKERVNIPAWAGIGAIVVGGALVLAGGRRSAA